MAEPLLFMSVIGGADGWAELLASEEAWMELRLLRRCTYAGRPFGEEAFLSQIEKTLQRKWRRWGFEKKTIVTGAAS